MLAGRRLRRGRRHHHQPRGPGQHASTRRSPRPGTARADWIIAAELGRPPRRRPRARVGRRDPGRDRAASPRRTPASPPTLLDAARPRRRRRAAGRRRPSRGRRRRPTPPRPTRPTTTADADAGRRRRADAPRPTRPRRPTLVTFAPAPADRRPRSTPTRCAWSPPASSTTRARCVQHAPVARRARARHASCAVNPYDFDRLGVAAGDRVRVHVVRGPTLTRRDRRRRRRAPGLGRGRASTSPGLHVGRADRRRARRSPTSGSRRRRADASPSTRSSSSRIDLGRSSLIVLAQGRHRLRAPARRRPC